MILKGTTVILYERTQSGTDTLGNQVFTETPTEVDNVLIGEPSTDEITSSISLYGKRAAYTLAIPKGDQHRWENARVDFFGQSFRAFGHVTQGIEELTPLQWNKKVRVARHDDGEDGT